MIIIAVATMAPAGDKVKKNDCNNVVLFFPLNPPPVTKKSHNNNIFGFRTTKYIIHPQCHYRFMSTCDSGINVTDDHILK